MVSFLIPLNNCRCVKWLRFTCMESWLYLLCWQAPFLNVISFPETYLVPSLQSWFADVKEFNGCWYWCLVVNLTCSTPFHIETASIAGGYSLAKLMLFLLLFFCCCVFHSLKMHRPSAYLCHTLCRFFLWYKVASAMSFLCCHLLWYAR